MSTNPVKLSTGTWPISTIRLDEWEDFFIAHKSPERPYILKSVPGGVEEKVTPPDDSPLWEPYNDAMRLYNRAYRYYLWLLAFATVDVPDDWILPPGKALALGIEGATDPRERKLQYIQHYILGDAADVPIVQAAADDIITKEERAAGAEKFPSDAGDEAGSMETAGSDTAE